MPLFYVTLKKKCAASYTMTFTVRPISISEMLERKYIHTNICTHTNPYVCVRNFPGGASGKECACQYRRHKRCEVDPWIGKIPWSRAWQPISVFMPVSSWTDEPGRLQSMGSQRFRHNCATDHIHI